MYGNPYTFTGRRLDTLDRGRFEIMYYRNRYYDTQTSRFLTQDPILINEDKERWAMVQWSDGMSLYQYAISRPVLFTDPEGRKIEIEWPKDEDDDSPWPWSTKPPIPFNNLSKPTFVDGSSANR